LQQVRQTVLDAYEYQAYPIEQLLDELRIQKVENRNPLYDVLMVLNNDGLTGNAAQKNPGGLHLAEVIVREGISKFDLTFFINDEPELGLAIEYSTELFAPTTIEKMSRHLRALAGAILRDKKQTINSLLWTVSGSQPSGMQPAVKELINEDF